MTDDPIRQALRQLPRHRPRDGFTGRVLARLDEPPPRAVRWRPALVTLTATAALLAVVLVPLTLRAPAPAPAPAPNAEPSLAPASATGDPAAGQAPGPRLERLRREREQLATELAQLRREAARPLPVVYLAGDEQVDLVIDLAELARRRPPGQAVPASNRRR